MDVNYFGMNISCEGQVQHYYPKLSRPTIGVTFSEINSTNFEDTAAFW